jgi:hypothetical protein
MDPTPGLTWGQGRVRIITSLDRADTAIAALGRAAHPALLTLQRAFGRILRLRLHGPLSRSRERVGVRVFAQAQPFAKRH